jgi:hypothetical protein
MKEAKMLGNCIIRNPTTFEKTFDAGSVCEAMLFFAKTHIVLDYPTLALFVQSNFLDDSIEMLKQGYITATYSPEFCGLYNESKGGVREHYFTLARLGGNNPSKVLHRGADVLLYQLESLIEDKGRAGRYHRELCKLIAFKDLNSEAIIAAVNDLIDPIFARDVAITQLTSLGVPAEKLGSIYASILPLDNNRFAINTNVNFSSLKQYTGPELYDNGHLFAGLADARLDIYLAAEHNAAFIGNSGNQAIVELLLKKTIGKWLKPDDTLRSIYDFISVDTPSVREAINAGSRTPRDFIKTMEASGGFKKWLNVQNPDKDLIQEMLREKAAVGWLEHLPVKAARFGIFSGGGMIADYFAPGASIVLGALDTFLMNRLAERWRPHFFVENQLKGFLTRDR